MIKYGSDETTAMGARNLVGSVESDIGHDVHQCGAIDSDGYYQRKKPRSYLYRL